MEQKNFVIKKFCYQKASFLFAYDILIRNELNFFIVLIFN